MVVESTLSWVLDTSALFARDLTTVKSVKTDFLMITHLSRLLDQRTLLHQLSQLLMKLNQAQSVKWAQEEITLGVDATIIMDTTKPRTVSKSIQMKVSTEEPIEVTEVVIATEVEEAITFGET